MEWRVCPSHGMIAVTPQTVQCTRCTSATIDPLDLQCDQLIERLREVPAVAPVDWRAWVAKSASLMVALLCTAMIAAVLISRMP